MQPKQTNTMVMKFRSSSSVLHVALPLEESAIRTLSLTLGIFAILYVTMVSMSIVNVIARKEAGDKASALRTVVGQLEHQYFALSQEINAASGSSLGLQTVSNTQYVHAPGALSAGEKEPSVRNEI